jgi:hypothetical protein
MRSKTALVLLLVMALAGLARAEADTHCVGEEEIISISPEQVLVTHEGIFLRQDGHLRKADVIFEGQMGLMARLPARGAIELDGRADYGPNQCALCGGNMTPFGCTTPGCPHYRGR